MLYNIDDKIISKLALSLSGLDWCWFIVCVAEKNVYMQDSLYNVYLNGLN